MIAASQIAARFSTAPVGGDEARRAAQDELRRAEYHRDDPGLLARVLGWVGDRLAWLFSGSIAGSATLVLVAVLVAAVVVATLRAGRPGRTGRGALDRDPLRPLLAADHRRTAEALAARGRDAEALREWLRAAVATVEARGVLDPRPGRTGGQIARQAGAALPGAADSLAAAVLAFDDVWFGGRPATAADVAAARQAADAVRDARLTAPVLTAPAPRPPR